MFRKEVKIIIVLIVLLLLFMYGIPRAFSESIVPPMPAVVDPPQTQAEQAMGQMINRPLMCGPMEMLIPTIQERGEIAVWRGVMYIPANSDNPLTGLHEVWLWVNPETGTWTIIEIHQLPDDSVMGCIYAFGLLPSHMPATESTTEPPQGPVINKME